MFRAGRRRAWADVEIVVVAVLGVAVRLRQFLSGRSLWTDEALVANDLAELSVVEALTQRSPRNQLAPPGFWVVGHLADAISSDEMMLRLFPLVCGIALVVVAVVYASRWIEHRPARFLLVSVIALSPSLIYYSDEVKQYGVEALLAMIAVVAVAERGALGRVPLVVLALVMLAFSIPSLLIVPVLGMLWLLTEARSRGVGGAVRYLIAPGAVIFVAWAVALMWTQLAKPAIMQDFWADAFAPLPTSAAHVEWWVRTTVGLSHLTVTHIGVPLHTEDPAWITTGSRIVALALWGLVIAGVVRVASAVRNDRRSAGLSRSIANWLAVVPAALAIVGAFAAAAVLELYPFRGRLILALVPLVAVAAAHGLDVLLERRSSPGVVPDRVRTVLAGIAAVVVVVAAGRSAASLIVDPYDRWDVEPAIEWIADTAGEDDAVFAYCLSDQQLQYYREHLDEAGIVAERCITSLALDAVLERVGERRTWFLHGHIREDRDAVELIAAHPSVVETFRSDSVIALLLNPGSVDP
ncbi:MAG: hypothetical protein QNM02_10250 [Acidimicrobiia bacterium]|nr:hypothetical protein [Acidimicrobiia bacterium]